ncbi:anaphase-promoting complex, cyclosome, subunit 4-domain-containing protein [Phaeosphaeriaceae sp. PMI808]|nr:anaphase-promoting complex, cyclosome, subunit 4-domain-containing protein [Phaeosphaeriaceae sp. PMI808]
MDLIAVVTDEENLDVYRINGQRAFGLKRKSEDVSVDALQWEFNGKSIAVSWSDGSTDLVNAETGKVSHKDLMLPAPTKGGDSMQEDENPPRVKCIGWGLNFIDVDAVKRLKLKSKKTGKVETAETDAFGQPTTEDWDAFKDETTIEDFLQRQPDFKSLDIAPDLPDQLTMMDMETLLPKLPAIPLPPALPFMRVSQADSGAFSSQVDVDSLLHSHHLKDHNSVDIFIRCSDRGTVHPSLYDSMETVNIHLPDAWGIQSAPLLHASHPYSCSHSLIMRTTSPDSKNSKLAFVPLTLNFIPSAGIYLHLIASKTSQLQNLLLYITQCLQRIRTYFNHARALPSKFMLNISETLAEKEQGTLTTQLYHLACTGNCPPLIHEWLVDDLAEQGHKRWDTTVSTSLTTLLALVHENLIPALDHCTIVLSRLRGLAHFHDRDWIFSAPLSDFATLLDVLRNMRYLAHTVLLYAGEEKRQFLAFSKWLRFVIDFEATEPESQSRGEMEGRDAGVDMGLVLDYVRFGMVESGVEPFLRGAGEEGGAGAGGKSKSSSSFEDTKKAVEVLRDGGVFKPEAVCLEVVLGHLKDGVTGLLRQVSAWQESNIQMNKGVVLEESTGDADTVVDMRMVFEPSTSTTYSFIAISSPDSTSTMHIHRLSHSLSTHAIASLSFPTRSRILDVKFADDASLLVLIHLQLQPDKTTLILRIPYTKLDMGHPAVAVHDALLPGGVRIPESGRAKINISPELVRTYTRHVFEGRFTPLKLIVNGRKGRRVIVVLGDDRKHYRVLDMDFRKRGTGDDSSDGDESGVDEDGDGDVEMHGL